MQPRLVSALAAAALIGIDTPRVSAVATDYTLGHFTLTVDTDESSVDIVNSVGDQVWKCECSARN